MPVDEISYLVLQLFDANPVRSQRSLARELGVSLGKVNYCVKALVRRGWVKVRNFRDSGNKAAYMYLLTPRGMEHKGKLTVQFLQRKVEEYEALGMEIRRMRRQAGLGK